MDSRRRRRGTRHAHSTLPDDDERLWNYARLVPLHSTPEGIKNAAESRFGFPAQIIIFAFTNLNSHLFSFPLISSAKKNLRKSVGADQNIFMNFQTLPKVLGICQQPHVARYNVVFSKAE